MAMSIGAFQDPGRIDKDIAAKYSGWKMGIQHGADSCSGDVLVAGALCVGVN